MQKYDVVTIYDKEFKVFHSIEQAKCVPYRTFYRTLSQCYDHPSDVKQKVYSEWCEWFEKMGSKKYGVYSANCHRFTMGGEVKFLGGMYYVYISRTRQELIPMEY